MKKFKFVSLLALGLVAFLSIPQWTYAQQEEVEAYFEKESYGFNFGIKLFGNLGHLIGKNDVNEAHKGWNDLVNDTTDLAETQKSGELLPLNFGPFFGGELTLSFIPRFTIGLGIGYIQFTRESTVILTENDYTMEFTRNPNVRAIPITLSLYYSIPFGKMFTVVASAGMGYYLGKFQNNIHETFDDEGIMVSFKSDSNTFGFHGGLDLELNINRTMALVFGISGRLAKLKDLMGTFSVDWEDADYDTYERLDQTLWYVEEDYSYGPDDPLAGKWYAGLAYEKEKPEWSFYRNVRKAEISLSSVALQIGFLIRLSQLFKKN